jgi:hypothetical protein
MFKYLRIILLLSLFHSQVLASTDFICTVNKADEDYNLVSTWEAAMDDAGSLTAADIKVFSHSGVVGAMVDGGAVNGASSGATATIAHATATQILLYDISGTFESGEQIYQTLDVNYIVAADGGDSPNLVLHIYADQGELAESGNYSISGNSTGISNTITITAPPGQRHDGKSYGTGARISNSGWFQVIEQYVNISWLSFLHTGASSSVVVRWPSVLGGGSVTHCIVTKDDNDQSVTAFYVDVSAGSIKIDNNLIYNMTNYGIYQVSSTGTAEINNNTIYGSTYGIYAKGAGEIRNNLCIGATIKDYYNDKATFVTNGSSDLTGTREFRSLTTSEFISITPGSEDYHLSSNAYSIDKGTDLGSSYSIDIDGRDRDASEDIWDLGCDEYVAPSTSIKPQVIITNIM